MSRVVRSWTFLVVTLAVAACATGWLLHALQDRTQQRAEAQAVQTALVVARLVANRNVDAGALAGGALPTDAEADMRQDVVELRSGGQVLGLEVWRSDGSPVFADDQHPVTESRLPAEELARVAARRPWTVHSDAGARGEASLDVFIPYSTGPRAHGGPLGLVEVLLPEQQLTASIADTTRRFDAVAAGFLVLVGAGMVLLRRRLQRREHQARHDALTGLLNRTGLSEDGRAPLGAATQQRPCALVVMDLDGFKAVNDTLGHVAGDRLLQQVGAALRSAAGPQDAVVRLGGDEFAVLVGDLSGPGEALERARHFTRQLQEGAFSVDGVPLSVEASAGVALAPAHGADVAALMQRADVAMYQAKRSRSGPVLYDPVTDHHDVGQLAVLVELREAVERDQLVLHYQPKVRLADQQVVGVEALVRWQHPTHGLLGPDAFVPLAESTGLIRSLTAWVLHEAAHQAASWLRDGRPLKVAVNISPRSLLDDDLVDVVLDAAARAGIPVALLELEITETAVMADPDRAAEVLRRLAALGATLSIDDFGAGYTSLAHLRHLPVTALKIDRSLVVGVLEHPEDEAITAAVVGLGHQLGMAVIAEGVETEEVLERLRDLGCDDVQGYLLSRPLPAPALEEWLAGWQAATGPAVASRPAPGPRTSRGAAVPRPRAVDAS